MNNLIEENNIYIKEYIIINENSEYKIKIEKKENEIIIESENYEIKLNKENLFLLFGNYNNLINDIDKIYKFIIKLFNRNKVQIKNITNISMVLVFTYENYKYFELNLKQKLNISINIEFLLNISCDAYASSTLDNTFTVFESIDNILYIIFASIKKSIICYDLKNFIKICEIKNKYISNFRHFLDKVNKRDLILTISYRNKDIKIWNLINWECILHIQKLNDIGWIYSSCIFCDNNINYIITSNYDTSLNSEPLQIFNFKGEKIKEIENSNENTYYVDIYDDKKMSKTYILVGNIGYIKSYDYKKNELYHKYCDNSNKGHISIVVKDNEDIVKLIESCNDGNIRIWDFHKGLLLYKIKIDDECLNGICLWSDNYLFVGCEDGTIKLIDLLNRAIIKNIINDGEEVLTVKSIFLPFYGNCLISQSIGKEEIKLWKINY